MTNNKQQTAVKLYTEEQLLNTAEAIRDYLKNYPEKFHESMIKKHLTALAPLELPSDEEIEQESNNEYQEQKQSYENSVEMFPIDFANYLKVGFIDGAKWMRNKIQGGEQ
jgi:hypothetical protein